MSSVRIYRKNTCIVQFAGCVPAEFLEDEQLLVLRPNDGQPAALPSRFHGSEGGITNLVSAVNRDATGISPLLKVATEPLQTPALIRPNSVVLKPLILLTPAGLGMKYPHFFNLVPAEFDHDFLKWLFRLIPPQNYSIVQ